MNKLIEQIVATSRARARKDINSWRTAIQVAENVDNPRRVLLYNLYDELILDAHLTAAMQRRILALTGANFSLRNEAGEVDSEKTELLKRPWFFKFINYALESLFFGYSVIQICDLDENGEISDIQLIKRRHIIPERGLFVVEQMDDKGIQYREDNKYYDWLLEIGTENDLGLLNKTAPHVLYKRFAQAAWSEYCEVFGMPLRYGKTNVKDVESLNRMEDMMISMGTASYAVIDNNEEISFVESKGGKGEVYERLIDKCNAEVSKLINGSVIGEASQGGSRSKEEVGERMNELITEADKRFIENYINFTLIPKIQSLGYSLEGLQFHFDKTKDTKALWEITQGLLNHYEIDEEFIKDTFGIPVTGKRKTDDIEALNARGFFG